MLTQKNGFLLIPVILFAISCSSQPDTDFAVDPEIKNYWYQGLAELSSYELEQARYGEIHKGEAVLIFVTEDFSAKKQVKLDNPGSAPEDAVSVLKLNMTKKFYTGIYPYSIMMSSFKPLNTKTYPHALKVTSSSQEWCGHTFMQLNQTKKGFNAQVLSYFESEGDQQIDLRNKEWLEDEIWQQIRFDPEGLPEGSFSIFPGSVHLRLRHQPMEYVQVQGTLSNHESDKNLKTYTLTYANNQRSLKIHFEKTFPYQIQGWEETHTSGFGASAKTLSTRATKKKTMMLDYWSKHNNEHLPLKEELMVGHH